jgi:hypothetical protein
MLCQCPFLQSHFDFIGNFDRHYGIFDGCGTSMPLPRMLIIKTRVVWEVAVEAYL